MEKYMKEYMKEKSKRVHFQISPSWSKSLKMSEGQNMARQTVKSWVRHREVMEFEVWEMPWSFWSDWGDDPTGFPVILLFSTLSTSLGGAFKCIQSVWSLQTVWTCSSCSIIKKHFNHLTLANSGTYIWTTAGYITSKHKCIQVDTLADGSSKPEASNAFKPCQAEHLRKTSNAGPGWSGLSTWCLTWIVQLKRGSSSADWASKEASCGDHLRPRRSPLPCTAKPGPRSSYRILSPRATYKDHLLIFFGHKSNHQDSSSVLTWSHMYSVTLDLSTNIKNQTASDGNLVQCCHVSDFVQLTNGQNWKQRLMIFFLVSTPPSEIPKWTNENHPGSRTIKTDSWFVLPSKGAGHRVVASLLLPLGNLLLHCESSTIWREKESRSQALPETWNASKRNKNWSKEQKSKISPGYYRSSTVLCKLALFKSLTAVCLARQTQIRSLSLNWPGKSVQWSNANESHSKSQQLQCFQPQDFFGLIVWYSKANCCLMQTLKIKPVLSYLS